MRKYACQRLYDEKRQRHAKSVVTLDGEGNVLDYGPLTEEIADTEWLGGLIILEKLETTTIAIHISEYNFSKNRPTENSVIRRLL